jgi:putative sterol carrier protein
MKFLSQEWCEAFQSLTDEPFARPSVSLTVQYRVRETPTGDVAFYQVIKDGELTEMAVGEHPDIDLSMHLNYATCLRLFRQEVRPSVAVFRGDIKVNGKMQHALALRSVVMADSYNDLIKRAQEITEYA